jgi:hypothetical protein
MSAMARGYKEKFVKAWGDKKFKTKFVDLCCNGGEKCGLHQEYAGSIGTCGV